MKSKFLLFLTPTLIACGTLFSMEAPEITLQTEYAYSADQIVKQAATLAYTYGNQSGFSTSDNLVEILFYPDETKENNDRIKFKFPVSGYEERQNTASMFGGKELTRKITDASPGQIQSINRFIEMIKIPNNKATSFTSKDNNFFWIQKDSIEGDYISGEINNVKLPACVEQSIKVNPKKKSSSILGRLLFKK